MHAPLDEQLAAVVEDVADLGVPEWSRLSVPAARRLEDELFTPEDPPTVDLVRNLAFEGPGSEDPGADRSNRSGGGPTGEVPVRVYRDVEPPAPVVVFYHGGGWTLGTLDSAGDLCRLLARRGECVVVSVDYRLAPEHPFPAPLDDAYAALEWVADVAESLGGDPDRLHVAGTSAGGGLAAAAALRARRFDGPDLVRQLLLYPMLDPDTDRASYVENADGPLLTRADVEWFWDRYCRSPVDASNPFAAPLRADDLSDLPPATIVTAGNDPLRDEGTAYADRLDAAGVPVEHLHYPAMAHGFLSLTDDVDAADAAFDEVVGTLPSGPD